MVTRKKAAPAPVVQNVDNSKTISGCQFYGVRWDAKAVEAIMVIARGLEENAKALHTMARIFQAQEVTIEAMVRIDESTNI